MQGRSLHSPRWATAQLTTWSTKKRMSAQPMAMQSPMQLMLKLGMPPPPPKSMQPKVQVTIWMQLVDGQTPQSLRQFVQLS